jgi:hypothetical protein
MRARTRAARGMATAMRVAGNKEGKGSKAVVIAKRMVDKCTAMATKRAMGTTTRVVSK